MVGKSLKSHVGRCARLIEMCNDLCYNKSNKGVLCEKISVKNQPLKSYPIKSIKHLLENNELSTLKSYLESGGKRKDILKSIQNSSSHSKIIYSNKIKKNLKKLQKSGSDDALDILLFILNIFNRYDEGDFEHMTGEYAGMGFVRFGDYRLVYIKDADTGEILLEVCDIRSESTYKKNEGDMILDNRVARILELYEPIDSNEIKRALEKRLKQIAVDDVAVNDVDVDLDGNITVEFSDEEGDIDIVFTIDPVDGPIAIIEPDEDEDDFLVMDLDHTPISTIDTKFGKYPNLLELSWLIKKCLEHY